MQAGSLPTEQPTKLAAMEGQYETEPVPMYLFGIVDTENGTIIGPSIQDLTSFLAAGDFSAGYPGLSDIEAADPGSTPTATEVQLTFQSYHIMIVMMGVIMLGVLLAHHGLRQKLKDQRWPYVVMGFLWDCPVLAISLAGRQPRSVGSRGSSQASSRRSMPSPSVPADQLLITICLFIVIYLVIFFIAWALASSQDRQSGPGEVPCRGPESGHRRGAGR